MKGIAIGALFAAAMAGHAQDIKLGLGLQAGFFVPSSKALRDALGDSWFSFGISPSVIKEKDGFKLDWDLAITGRSRDGSRVTMIRPTFGATLGLGVGEAVPYVAGRAGFAYVDYRIEQLGGRVSGRRVNPSMNFEAGILFSRRLGISVRYDWIGSSDGIGFSGFSLQASYQVLKF